MRKRDAQAMRRARQWINRQGYMSVFKGSEGVAVYRNGQLGREPILYGSGEYQLEALHDAARRVAERESIELPKLILQDMEAEYE